MNNLIENNNGSATTTSKKIADVFGKVHRDVVRALDNIECSDGFRAANFAQSFYLSPQNKKITCYDITRDGFAFLCMGFTGKRASVWKEKYIEAFNQMEKGLLNVDSRMSTLTIEGKTIEEAGKMWSATGQQIKKQKKQHAKKVDALISEVQLNLGFTCDNEKPATKK